MIEKELRARAEDVLRMTRREVAAMSSHDVQRLVYELQVHQVEFEMQNDSLRSAQHDLERSQEQYHELFDSAPAGYLMVSAAGMIVRANAAAMQLVQSPAPNLIGQRFSSLLQKSDLPTLQRHLDAARWEKRSSCELHLTQQTGSTLLVRLDITPVPSRTADFLIVLTDMSERQRQLELVERMNQELEGRVAARTADLAARNLQLEAEISARERSEMQRQALEKQLREVQRLESLGMLAGGIAHELNNLMVAVLGNADLLLTDPALPEHCRDTLHLMRSAGRKASEVTQKLNIFAGRGEHEVSKVSLVHVVASSLQHLRSRLPSSVQLLWQIGSDLPPVGGDKSQLQQLVTNLLTNAIEAVGSSGAITVAAHAKRLDASSIGTFQHSTGANPGEYVVFLVRDSGIGIDEENVSRIFEPFFTTKFIGRGLGLATVLGIVQGHRGALRVQSFPGGGSCFEVALPVAEQRQDSDRPPSPRVAPWTGSGTCLLIDDDNSVRATMTQLLMRMGFDAVAANSGQAGLDRYERGDVRFHFIVLDWSMPGLSGEDVLAAVRKRDPTLPVILISGYHAENLAPDDAYVVRLQKPMTLKQLEHAIRSFSPDDALPVWPERATPD